MAHIYLVNDSGLTVNVYDSGLNLKSTLTPPTWGNRKIGAFFADSNYYYVGHFWGGGAQQAGIRCWDFAFTGTIWETEDDELIGLLFGMGQDSTSIYINFSLYHFILFQYLNRKYNKSDGSYIQSPGYVATPGQGWVSDSGTLYMKAGNTMETYLTSDLSDVTDEVVKGNQNTGQIAHDNDYIYTGHYVNQNEIGMGKIDKSDLSSTAFLITGLSFSGIHNSVIRSIQEGDDGYYYALLDVNGGDDAGDYLLKINSSWAVVNSILLPSTWKDLSTGPGSEFPESPSISPSASASPSPGIPDIWTMDANPIGATTATIHGNVNPAGLSTTVWFETGITPEVDPVFDTTTPQVIGSGHDNLLFSANISIISGANFYRAVAQNSFGIVYGAALAFPSPATYSPSASPSPTPSRSASVSPSESVSPSASESPSSTISVSPSISPSASESPSVSPSISPSASASPSVGSESPSESPSVSPSASESPSISPSASVSKSPSPSISSSASESPSESPTPSLSISPSASYSASVSPSASKSASASPSASDSPSPSVEIAIRGVTLFYLSDFIGGAATALDSIDGNALIDRDRAFVIVNGVFHVYYLDSDLGGDETTPPDYSIIAPDTNAGLKRWVKAT